MIGSFPSQMRSPIGTIFGPIGILHVVRVEGSLAAVAQPVESQFGESGPEVAQSEPLIAALGDWRSARGPRFRRLADALTRATELANSATTPPA